MSTSSIKDLTCIAETEIALLGVWDDAQVRWADTYPKRAAALQNVTSAIEPRFDRSVVVWDTGGDGGYTCTLRHNTGLTVSEKKQLYEQRLAIDFEVQGTVYVGMPEYIGDEAVASKQGAIEAFALPAGTYVIDLYSLVKLDDAGEATYLQYVICFHDTSKYKTSQKHTKSSQGFVLRYPALSEAAMRRAQQESAKEATARKQIATEYVAEIVAKLDSVERGITSTLVARTLSVMKEHPGWKSYSCTVEFDGNTTTGTESYVDASNVSQDFSTYHVQPYTYDAFDFSINGYHILASRFWSGYRLTVERKLFRKPKITAQFTRLDKPK